MKVAVRLDVGPIPTSMPGDVGTEREGREQRGPAAAQRVDDIQCRQFVTAEVRRKLRHVAKEMREGLVGLALVAPGRRHFRRDEGRMRRRNGPKQGAGKHRRRHSNSSKTPPSIAMLPSKSSGLRLQCPF